MKKQFLLASLILAGMFTQAFGQDKFAEIATRLYEDKSALLIDPLPPPLEEIYLPTDNNKSARFKPMEKLDTPEELQKALAEIKDEYRPYLQELAPELSLQRERLALDKFQWRIGQYGNPQDLKNAITGKGEWVDVTIPHYGEPLGRAVTYYYKEIDEDQIPTSVDGRTYLCFKGVDYKATVYLNEALVGTHEGFFAPFEFDVTEYITSGKNRLVIQVENDFSTTGSKDDKGNRVIGDKIYAATGPGYDDSKEGWHHGPAGMGIYQNCYFESRAAIHVNDVFVRPLVDQESVEAWVEVNSKKQYPEHIKLLLSVYGLNFDETVVENLEYIPQSVFIPGVGDLVKPTDNKGVNLPMGYGVNFMRVTIPMADHRVWDLDTPWLYQMQVKVVDNDGKLLDEYKQDFGMRKFQMDTISKPKGMMYLNDRPIRLRGANTMGHLQQCVMKGDFDQLVDDILLAKLCNMNYLRLTQRPVQSEIYTYCDKLGLMTQIDFPLFGALRRNKFAEAIKQVEEMERLGRNHPSTIVASYINERFPNAEGNPQRSFSSRAEYNRIFSAFDQAVLLSNPDRVIKAGDGDYDPPSPGLPDNHCYNGWYNGHGLGLGKMYKGYWMPVKPDWYYACGEFGSEGLDPRSVMYKYYPKEWLPKDAADEKEWRANRIALAQTQNFHWMWYPTQNSLDGWIDASQEHQSWVTKFTTEAFRRDNRMVSFAIHLFIDAWPAGWMKTIMDVDRQPKEAYFAYRDALSPLMVSLRSDRTHFYVGENIKIEAWISNDTPSDLDNYILKYQLEDKGKVVFANTAKANIASNLSTFQGYIDFIAPKTSSRKYYTLRIQLCDEKGNPVHENTMAIDVFPRIENTKKVYLTNQNHAIKDDLNLLNTPLVDIMDDADVIIITDFADYIAKQSQIDEEVSKGKKAIFLELEAGSYSLVGKPVKIAPTVMGKYYFVSPRLNHPMTKQYDDFDFKCWYDAKEDCIMPLLENTISAPDFSTIIGTGSTTWTEDQGAMSAASELTYGAGVFRICEITLAGKTATNPTAAVFLVDMINK